jgi:hypothetical protein
MTAETDHERAGEPGEGPTDEEVQDAREQLRDAQPDEGADRDGTTRDAADDPTADTGG